MEQPSQTSDPVRPQLGMWDAVSIIVGIVVGTSIFKVPQVICGSVAGLWETLAVWAIGGVLAFVGALCYAELATTYPHSGGDYVYLTRAYGRWAGFLFGWAQLVVILTGSIGIMAFAFADYAVPLTGVGASDEAAVGVSLAVAAIAVLTLVNIFGVIAGKTMQNLLTVAKVIGLAAVLFVGFLWGGDKPLFSGDAQHFSNFGLAMILVMYAYGGWNDAAYVAADVRETERNLPRALFAGILIITVVYLLVNAAYIYGLGFDGIRKSSSPAADVLALTGGAWAANVMRVLVMISALGAINGLVFTGSRVCLALGEDHRALGLLGRWNAHLGAPVWALVAQGAVAIALVLSVGTQIGRDAIDRAVELVAREPVPWNQYFGGFDTLFAATAPVFWLFFVLTGGALMVLRMKDRDLPRPFRVPLYPVVPIIFCLTCLYFMYSSLVYAKYLTLLGIVPLVAGLPLYWLGGGARRQ